MIFQVLFLHKESKGEDFYHFKSFQLVQYMRSIKYRLDLQQKIFKNK